ncbi:PREDICTED: uncharacterized protein LOC105454954 [Wasmannia auropunctata]|uniref:uncharacterized protein LOC105454954 n=1 Tax=Wasmannia auropunctata TaxID=64793 RepID=UPI0005F0A6AC|nr:PREDICTED: uncharacterized protein LOC105454954 [Wasmannia auropunctata]
MTTIYDVINVTRCCRSTLPWYKDKGMLNRWKTTVHSYNVRHSYVTFGTGQTENEVSHDISYLSQGDSVKLKHAEFRIGKSTVHKIVNETCWAIWTVLQPIVLKTPSKEDWKSISEEFMNKWQFPNCLGAIDGRHMRIQAPPNSGSNFYNYKQFFSMVLLATCDATYKFTWIDIGQYGSISDGGTWANTDFANDMAADLVDTKLHDGSIREGQCRRHFSPHFAEIGRLGANRADAIAKEMRNTLKDYFVSSIGEAQAPWQYDCAFRGANINLPQ